MTISLASYWGRLTLAAEPWQTPATTIPDRHFVHPDDAAVLAANHHSFNLDFPPPAFVGDVDKAPIVILMASGGYDSDPATGTPSEFLEARDYREHLEMLGSSGVCIPQRLSRYYTQNTVFPWVKDGKAAIVNAVAYRTPNITQEPENKNVARLLPSANLHRQWLREELLPAAAAGERCVVAHRWSLWDLTPRKGPSENVCYSTNPVSEHLSKTLRTTLEKWLSNK